MKIVSVRAIAPPFFTFEAGKKLEKKQLVCPPLKSYPHFSANRFRFIDQTAKLAVYLAEEALSPLSLSPQEKSNLSICLGIDQGTFTSNQEHQDRIRNNEPLSPGIFTNTLPNIPGALISITQQIYGSQDTFASGPYSFLHAIQKSFYLLQENPSKTVICGHLSVYPPSWNVTDLEFGILLVLQGNQAPSQNTLEFTYEVNEKEKDPKNQVPFPFYLKAPYPVPFYSGEASFALLLAYLLQQGADFFDLGMQQGRGRLLLKGSFLRPVALWSS